MKPDDADNPRADTPDARRTVLAYHERTKHHFARHARSLGYMDWDTQPDPFRRFEGAESIALDEAPLEDGPFYDEVHRPANQAARPIDRAAVSRLFYDSLALSAWKQAGSARWALRVNPSSGNLHPTEGYLLAGPIEGLRDRPGLYHYAPLDHALEVRADLSADDWAALTAGLPHGSVLVGLSSIHWRESWKYGERAYRYCQHDVGHAVAAVAIAASMLGWEARMLESVRDEELGVLLGIDRQTGIEAEHPDCLLVLYPHTEALTRDAMRSYSPSRLVLDRIKAAVLPHRPAKLSGGHHDWAIIDAVGRAAARSAPPGPECWWSGPNAGDAGPESLARQVSARQIVRQRRSAQQLDAHTSIPADVFYGILGRLLPAAGRVPFASLPWKPCVHLVLFVHRVEGVAPGLYCLVREPGERPALEAAMDGQFEWRKPESCPDSVPLYRLASADCRAQAATISCQQAIASDGAFAVAMPAEFEHRIAQYGPWFYRRLFWESGAIGQVLYLEAEAAGVRGTGIGCFFDDGMHELLGLTDRRYQSLYHFTVGGPVEDVRIRTQPPYADRQRPRRLRVR